MYFVFLIINQQLYNMLKLILNLGSELTKSE